MKEKGTFKLVKKAADAVPNKKLRDERKLRGWSQKYIADRLGVERYYISRWERGSTSPSPHYRQQLCTLLGKNAEELGLLHEEEMDNDELSSLSSMVWNIPFRRSPCFTGREAVLKHLHEKLRLVQITAISGLGGIGKTQTAIEFAYRFRTDYSTVLWVRAETSEVLIAEFMSIAGILNVPEKDEHDQLRVVEAVKVWLNEHIGWLLVLDNVVDFKAVANFLPQESKGHIVLTTRTQAIGTLAEHIDMDKMKVDEGALFLLRRSKLLEFNAHLENASKTLCVQARTISQLLDGLPLALDQAGAYIEETGCSLLDYLEHYQAQRGLLLSRRGNLVMEHLESVSATFSLSLEKVEQANPIAADLLRLCSFLSADDIPVEIITEGLSEQVSASAQMIVRPLVVDDALAVLRKYSLLQRNTETKTVTIHRLVQAVLKEGMEEDEQRKWVQHTVHTVNNAFPEGKDVAKWPYCQRYLSHAEVCAQLIDQWKMVFPEAGRLLYQMGVYLMEHALYRQAEGFFCKARDMRMQALGPMHPDTIESLNTLAVLYGNEGKYAQAEPLFQQVLAIRQHSVGLNRLDVGESLNDLALLYYHQGKYAQAEPLYQQSLNVSKLNLGETHHYVGIVLNNLAMLYRDWSKYTQAEPLFQQALLIHEEQLTAEHPDVATIRNNLALLYVNQGRYEQAELLCHRTLEVLERTLGGEHPRTTQSLSILAMLYAEQGQYELAEPLYLRSLLIREKVLGAEHPRTIQSFNSLAKLHVKQGRYDEAELYYQQILVIQEKTLGPEHINVATTLDDYIFLLIEAGRETEVATMEARIKKIRMK